MEGNEIMNWCYAITFGAFAIISAIKVEDTMWKILFVMIGVLGLHIANTFWRAEDNKSSPTQKLNEQRSENVI